MADPRAVKDQLKTIGADKSIFCRPERRELANILFDNENIHQLINGQYSGGFAILCATDQRILLVDKKPFYLTVEDIRYEMISDVMFNNRLMNSTLLLGTMHKSITFTSYNQASIRRLTNFIQLKVVESRQNHSPIQQAITPNLPDDLGAFGVPIKRRRNPYALPVMIRHRASKFT
jgi:hypothetical protein